MNKLLTALAVLLTTVNLHAGWFTSDQTDITNKMTEIITAARQPLIEKWNLLATAKKVEIHEVVMIDNAGNRTKSAKEMIGCFVRCTIRWEGPVTKDGFTKVILYYDKEVQRFTDSGVLASNGVLNDEFAAGAQGFLQGALAGWAAVQQQQ